MLIHSASQLITLQGGAQRGHRLGDLSAIENGAVLIRGNCIEAIGTTPELLAAFPQEEHLDAQGGAVLPGFVDPHTHLVWAGDRATEFEMRLEGKTYLDIQAAGGGIVSTVRATRQASYADLARQTRDRTLHMFSHGTTTAEAKTGYGLDLETEIRMLQVILDLDREGALELVPTWLGAHSIPPEYAGNADAYTEFLVSQALPAVKIWWENHAFAKPLPFCDVFCETGAFSLAQSTLLLETAQKMGFPLKIHADEFENLGGASLAARLGAVSADHLVTPSMADIRALAESETVAVALPCTPFGLAQAEYTPARQIIAADGLLAIATDLNPGTAWCESMQFALALACRMLKLTPAQALAAATINAAAAIQRADRIGSIEPGKQADLLVLSVADYRHLAYRFGGNLVKWVIKKGKVYQVGNRIDTSPAREDDESSSRC